MLSFTLNKNTVYDDQAMIQVRQRPAMIRTSQPGRTFVFFCIAMTAASALAQAGEGWPTTRWRIECHDAQDFEDCSPADEVSAWLLEEASVFLSGLGFRAPTVTADTLGGITTYYVGNMSDEETAESGFTAVYKPVSETIWLRSDKFFAMGEPGEAPDGPKMHSRQLSIFAPVHELFHAITKTYQPGMRVNDGKLWLWEGMANAVMMSFSASHLNTRWPPRRYNQPLNEREKNDAYGTWLFWSTLGELLGSNAKVAYLGELLQSDFSSNRGLHGLDTFLQPDGGLYEQLPRVFAQFDTAKHFDVPLTGETSLASGQSVVEYPIWGEVNEVAGHAIEWTVEEQSGRPVVVDLRFDEDHPSLHLIVDGQPYDSDLGERNVYSTMLDGKSDLKIVVANVAPQAIDSRKLEFTLLVTLRELAPCEPDEMMAAIDPMGNVMAAGDYMNTYSPGGSYSEHNLLMPVAGELRIAGFAQGGGAGCTDPIGTNPMLTAESRQGAADAARQQAGAIASTGMPEIDAESDALIQVYSPNAFAWQTGVLSDPLMFDHGGTGGWPANSAANVVIRILNVAPGDLEAGKTYTAESVAPNPFGIPQDSDEAHPYNTIFTRWDGTKERVGIPPEMMAMFPAGAMQEMENAGFMQMAENAFAFQGTSDWIYLQPGTPLTGKVTIRSISAGLVTGTFELSGNVGKQRLTKEFSYDRRTNRLTGDRIVKREMTTGSVSVSGSFSAPAVEQVYRGMRPISNTVSLMPEQEKKQ